jgi:hypothetical protein
MLSPSAEDVGAREAIGVPASEARTGSHPRRGVPRRATVRQDPRVGMRPRTTAGEPTSLRFGHVEEGICSGRVRSNSVGVRVSDDQSGLHWMRAARD